MKITKTILNVILIIMMAIALTSCAEYDQDAIDETQSVEQNFRNIMNKLAANDATGAYMKIFDQSGNKLYQVNYTLC